MKSFKEFVYEAARWHIRHQNDSEVVHHATNADFDGNFRPFSHFGSSKAARAASVDKPSDQHHIYAARIRLGNVAHIPDTDGSHSPKSIVNLLHYAGHITDAERNDVHSKIASTEDEDAKVAHVVNLLKKKNIDTLSYTNCIEDSGSRSYMITDPKQVRVLRKTKAPLNKARGEASQGSGSDRGNHFHFYKGTPIIVHPKDKNKFERSRIE